MKYVKNQKEAIAIVKQMVADGQIAQDVAEKYFPELKENEDEKIRKSLKDCFEWLRDDARWTDVYGSSFESVFAWLEKQGTPAKLSEEEQNRFAKGVLTSCAMSFINYLDAYKYEGKMCVSNGECEDIENAFHNAMWDRLHRYYCKYIEKQGEQKSIDNLNQQEVMDIAVAKCFDEQNHTNYCENLQEKAKWSPLDEHCIRQLESMVKEEWRHAENVHNSEKVKKMSELMFFLKTLNPEKKPVEWSEKDNEHFSTIIHVLEDRKNEQTEVGIEILNKEIAWLKFLKNRYVQQPKQEWSEEDMCIVAKIMFAFKTKVWPSTEDCEEIINRLKSLCPQPKNE